ncbi:hypothetical protein GCM10023147_52060 [Tsukamurella soli]|uniref:Uncharacterized protein n=1 Tax=Tsukamurella soli TaxID=644556 RepID=A0ABP8KK30_9ACTN
MGGCGRVVRRVRERRAMVSRSPPDPYLALGKCVRGGSGEGQQALAAPDQKIDFRASD